MLKEFKPIIIIAGDSKSIFFEIFFKSLNFKKFKSPIILICSLKLLKRQMKVFNFKKNIKVLNSNNLNEEKLNNTSINLINIEEKNNNSLYIQKMFNVAIKLIKSGVSKKFINGPINKKFLKKKFPGITEFISYKFGQKKNAMLIYNKSLSVCPITTHLPLKFVNKKISKKLIFEKAILINKFYKDNFNFIPKIAVTGLNPHCETVDKFNEDKKIISPAIEILKKKGLKIEGPFPADTIFLKQNRIKYNVILGMYHDQVLSPFKALYEYDAINITLGLPFFRLSPDHGPNIKMINQNLSDPISLIKTIEFLDRR